MLKRILLVGCYWFSCVMVMVCIAGCGNNSGSPGDPVSSNKPLSTPIPNLTWQISLALSQNEVPMPMGLNAVSSDIATTDSGKTLAVWNQYDGSKFIIVASEYRPGSGWSTPVMLSKRIDNSYAPRIKSDSKGNAIVIWRTDQDDLGLVHYSRVSGWQNEYHLPYNCAYFDIATSPDDSFFLVMSYWDGQHFIISSRQYAAGNGWTELTCLQTDTSLNAFSVAVAFGNNGDGFAVWEQYDRDITQQGARRYIWSSRYTVSTGWEEARRIGGQSAGHASSPMVGMDGKGNAVVVWTQLNGEAGLPETTRSNICFNHYEVGVGWGVDEILSDNNPGNAYMPTVAGNSDGNIFVVWRQSTAWRYGKVHLWFRSFSSGKGWGPTVQVSKDIYWADDEGYQGRITTVPALIVDHYGNALVLWDFENNDTSNNIASSRYIAESGWTTPSLIDSPSAGYGYGPKVALEDSGHATAIWCNGTGLVEHPVISVWINRLE